MPQHSYPSGGRALRRKRRNLLPEALALAAVSIGLAALLPIRNDMPDIAAPSATSDRVSARDAVVVASTASIAADDRTLDPTASLKPETFGLARNAPLVAASPPVRPDAAVEPPAPAQEERARPLPSSPIPETAASTPAQDAPSVEAVPLPVPRPVDLGAPAPAETPQTASRPVSRRTRTAALPATPEDNRSFFEKLLGVQPDPSPGPALAYAAPDSRLGTTPGARLGSAPTAGEGVAVYDISARVVTLPNGEKLEAHSGLGDKLDDPRYVNVRMRGATPPGIYDLTERERLFHGVRAIRLTPVGGNSAVYGRDGLLAHTYMLGPNGDSNGCISFKNYDRFLQAFLKGEVKRLVVVAGRGHDLLPSLANSRSGPSRRSASSARDS